MSLPDRLLALACVLALLVAWVPRFTRYGWPSELLALAWSTLFAVALTWGGSERARQAERSLQR